MHFRSSHDGRHFLFLDDLPVDEIFDIGVVGVNDDHFGRTAGCAAGFDCTCCAVTDFQEAHEAGRFAAT